MKAILEFNLPEDREEYDCCIKGVNYISALQEIVEVIRNRIKYQDDEEYAADGVYSAQDLYEKIYEKIFWICKENGFSPWED